MDKIDKMDTRDEMDQPNKMDKKAKINRTDKVDKIDRTGWRRRMDLEGKKDTRTQQELTPCEQGRRRESSFLPRFFWISFVKRDFEKRIFQFRVRASVRPSVQKPIAIESVDFASPKMGGVLRRDKFHHCDKKLATSCQSEVWFAAAISFLLCRPTGG